MSEINDEPPKTEKRVELELEIAAPVAEVWRALTEGQGLQNWFPLEARVTPGVGGKVFVSWGPEFEGEGQITEWEPEKRFAWRQEPMSLVEWTLESRGGKTLVRLVQSSFMGESDWEKEWYDSTQYGWSFILISLGWWLERHSKENRSVTWPRLKVQTTRADAYRKLVTPGGLFLEKSIADFKKGDRFALTAATGEHFSGEVKFVVPSRGFLLSIHELNDALLWFSIEGGPDSLEVQAWLSTFAVAPSRLQEFKARWQARLQEIFAA